MRILDIPQILTDAAEVREMRHQLGTATAMIDVLRAEISLLKRALQQAEEKGNLYYQAFVDAERKTHGR